MFLNDIQISTSLSVFYVRGILLTGKWGDRRDEEPISVTNFTFRSSLHSKFYKNSVSFTFSPNVVQVIQIREETNSELHAVFINKLFKLLLPRVGDI